MINELKKALLIGVGAVAATYEKANELISEMVQKGKLTVEEGKELTEELKRDFKEKTSSTTNKVKSKFDDLKPITKDDLKAFVQESDIPSRLELEALRRKIEELEEKLNRKEES
ncbi:hypothetical protein CPJCM30710_16890 [Clostridium polyendosporum]|uniref:Polyhydroxyalkanoate synthesis regulator phasin n=1 Tax=Clostridium polyendosporum TaxID=69208 RepID=A0A919S0H3_9CLOT|nr:phasin family protein [Clostridium polyendosporum]GIM29023.1 hypothetical protein CPJCM30710_16890 [Clostridium polyendosporum]